MQSENFKCFFITWIYQSADDMKPSPCQEQIKTLSSPKDDIFETALELENELNAHGKLHWQLRMIQDQKGKAIWKRKR